jgi:predicted ribosome quality control (RQC) complex YloA/Tae2 family protein
MREISSLELSRIAKELKSIEGSHLRKFYEIGEGEFELSFYKDGLHFVYAKLLKTINISKYSSEHEQASEFAMQIRRRLENLRLESVYQHGSDRILVFDFNAYKLIFEMFAKGNVVLVDSEFSIIALYKRLELKERKLDYKVQYTFPKSSACEGSALEVIRRLVESEGEKKLIAITKYFDYGPLYVENAIMSVGLKPDERLGSLKEGKAVELAKALEKTREEAMVAKPRLYKKEHDYSLVPILKYDNSKENVVEYDSLSSLLDDFYLSERGKKEWQEEAKEKEAIKRSIEQQKELVKRYEDEAERYARIGNAILLHMHTINALIEHARSKKKPTIEELKEFEDSSIKVVGIDLKNKKIKVKIV